MRYRILYDFKVGDNCNTLYGEHHLLLGQIIEMSNGGNRYSEKKIRYQLHHSSGTEITHTETELLLLNKVGKEDCFTLLLY